MSEPSREPEPRTPHLRAVPTPRADEQRVASGSASSPVAGEVQTIRDVAAEVEAVALHADEATVLARPRFRSGFGGSAQSPQEGFGTIPSVLTHAGVTLGSAAVGGAIGGLAAGSWRGAGIGALANLSILGLSAAVLGSGRLSTTGRILYAVLALGAGAGAGYLVWRRMR
jgi:hypothetical protein